MLVLAPLTVDDLAALPERPPPLEVLHSWGMRSLALTPLGANGAQLGLLCLVAAAPGAFLREHEEIATEIANQLAIALQQARFRTALQQANSTLLLVEDNPNDVLLFQRAYSKAQVGYPLQVVHDGQATIDYLGGNASYQDRARYPLPAVVLLDLKLPRKSGHEVLA